MVAHFRSRRTLRASPGDAIDEAVNMDFLPGNRIDLLTSGSEYFPALIGAIESALVEVRLESYIFEDDVTGRRVLSALIQAAQRGVAVHLLVDGFGASGFMSAFGNDLANTGVEVRVYRPEVARFKFRRHRLRRMHRKLVTVDARIAFVGGINIIDDMNIDHRPKQTPPATTMPSVLKVPCSHLSTRRCCISGIWWVGKFAATLRCTHLMPGKRDSLRKCDGRFPDPR